MKRGTSEIQLEDAPPPSRECLRQQEAESDEEEEVVLWKNKPIYWWYHWLIEELADIRIAYQWLQKAGLKDSIEALIMTSHEQAPSKRCQLCKDAPETVKQMVGCKMLAGTAWNFVQDECYQL